MPDSVITKQDGGGVSLLVPEIWSKNYYESLQQVLAFAPLMDRSYEGEIASLGDTVLINTIPDFDEATEVGEADAVDASGISTTQQKLIINKMVAKDFIITNVAQLQSLPFVEDLKAKAVYAILKKIEKIIIASIIPHLDNQKSYASGTTLGFAELLEMKEVLDTADCPMADRHLVLGSAQINDLLAITNFTSSDFITSGSPVLTGQLPSSLLGFMPHFTNMVGNVVYGFHKSFMTMANQKGMEVKEYDLGVQGKRQSRINSTTLFGLKQLDEKRVATIS